MALDVTSSTAISDQSDVGMDNGAGSLKTPDKRRSPEFNYRQNHVTTVLLAGVNIVCLHIDGKERLCLAQISNTLLKQFSYNEIHNRRVALGITCVQCTPVQLEILRRAGAMPISSRRCGMITKREAERLVKSFLEDNRPPKLPENFYFEIEHECGWGCRGKFEPSRYNSSRAKCIKCNFCNLFFSPNKFIFHFHRGQESKYSHPDAANFNSWRRHLTLVPGMDADDISHAWEDVKAMFNGGSRKRMLSSPAFQDNNNSPTSPEIKKPKLQMENNILSKPNFGNQFQNYSMFSLPNKAYHLNSLGSPNNLALQYQMGKTDYHDSGKPSGMAVNPWRSPADFIIPSYDLLWANQFNMRSNGMNGYRQNYFTQSPPIKELSDKERQTPSDTGNSSEDEGSVSALNVPIEDIKSGNTRLSAFRPVLKSGIGRDLKENDTVENITEQENVTGHENEDSDVDIDDDCVDANTKHLDTNSDILTNSRNLNNNLKYAEDPHVVSGSANHREERQNEINTPATECEHHIHIDKSTNETVNIVNTEDGRQVADRNTIEDEINGNHAHLTTDELSNMSKDDLQKLLEHEMNVRQKVENDINRIKEGLQEQVSKEKSQRDEIAKQLQSMKDALCNELEQERKIRFSMQQKLKEAHDALHNFSCKMLASRQCAECAFKAAAAAIPR